jgi:anti-anti-sigma regulatory factor
MLKIRRRANGDVVLTISGSLQADTLGELSALLGAEGGRRSVVLDLKDLVIVDDDAIRFLCACERDGIVLRNCPRYIRAWMARVLGRP